MTNPRAAVAIVVLSGVLAHCASPPPPAPHPVPPPVPPPVVRPLAEPGAEFSEWLPLPAEKAAHIGRKTGVAAAWYRCSARGAGELEVTLMSLSGKLSYQVFDDSIVLPSRKENPVVLARADTSAGPGRSTFDVGSGVYYIRVATETPQSTDGYVLTLKFTKHAPPPQPRVAEVQPLPVPVPVPVPLPKPVPPPPSAPVPETLADGTRDNAVPLAKETPVNLSVGQGNAYRTRWAKYTIEKPSYYALCVTLIGAPVTVNTYRNGTFLHSTTLRSSEGITGTVPASTLWFEIQSSSGAHSDATVHLVVHPKSTESGFIKRGSQTNPCAR